MAESVRFNTLRMEKLDMEKKLIIALTVFFTFSASLGALAMNCEEMDHGEHGGMAMKGEMIVLTNDINQGVKAMAHLKDVRDAMSKMNMKETHHFMVMFMDTTTGEPIEQGSVALKIVSPSGENVGPVKLMGMQGHFGADITLNEKGRYGFTLGTKLTDGEKRLFEFAHTFE